MVECCCPEPRATDDDESVSCAACHGTGKPVPSLTVKALLTASKLSRFEPAQYRFCPDANCQVVYFARCAQTFRTGDLRVLVWQKQAAGQRTVCYCFGENEADIRAEIERDGQSRAVERVRAHIVAGRCACEVRNPRGACCLGDVAMAVDRMRQAILSTTSRP